MIVAVVAVVVVVFPFCFEFTELPEPKNVCFSPKVGNFQHISLNIFSASFSLSSPSENQEHMY